MSGEVPASPESSQAAPGGSAPALGAPAAVPGQFGPGSQIVGYRLLEQIGRGGMAVVYRAIDLRLDRTVALKILAPELARDEAFRHRFTRECRAAAAVDHPCIIPVFDAGEASGVLFIAMRYVSGRDVRTLLDREGPLPALRVVNVIEQVASALDAAHARGLVHRDVKPANMLLDSAAGSGQRDHVYLADFGLTKQSQLNSSLTSTGQFLGTLDYIAPEQIEGSKLVDGRADLYSLACAAFEMLCGTPPFQRDQGVAVIWAQISAPPPRLTDRRPDLPPAVDQVLAKAMAKAPGDRYQTCLEFAAALRGAGELAADPAAAAGAPGRPSTQLAQWVALADVGEAARAGPAGAGPAGADEAAWPDRRPPLASPARPPGRRWRDALARPPSGRGLRRGAADPGGETVPHAVHHAGSELSGQVRTIQSAVLTVARALCTAGPVIRAGRTVLRPARPVLRPARPVVRPGRPVVRAVRSVLQPGSAAARWRSRPAPALADWFHRRCRGGPGPGCGGHRGAAQRGVQIASYPADERLLRIADRRLDRDDHARFAYSVRHRQGLFRRVESS